MSKPWHSDTDLEEAEALGIIMTHHPDLKPSGCRRLDSGWDNDIFLVESSTQDRPLIFRFTRRRTVIPFAQTELAVLPLLAGRLSTPVPEILHSGLLHHAFPYFSYSMLPGTIAANLGLTENERASLAPAIVTLLNEIHSLPISGELAKALPPDTLGRLNIPKRMGKIRDKISVTDALGIAFPATIPDKIESLLDPDEELRIPHCLVHGDLYARNILIDNRSQISGLIDWTDVHLGHPAKDFAFLLSFLPPQIFENIRTSYRYYSEPLLDLAFMSALNLTCNLAEYAVDIQDQPLMTECRIAFNYIRENFASFR